MKLCLKITPAAAPAAGEGEGILLHSIFILFGSSFLHETTSAAHTCYMLLVTLSTSLRSATLKH